MLQKLWFKVFIWFMATFFFFLASAVIISIFKPGPSEAEVMQFMMSMMQAMEGTLMGVSMTLEKSAQMQSIMAFVRWITLPVIVVSIIAGVAIRISQRRDEHV